MYTFLHSNQLSNPDQSGFRPSDSCINQLISIAHATASLEVRSVFLDLSKANDMKSYFIR